MSQARYSSANENPNKQVEAEKLIKMYKNEPNYHEKAKTIKTEQSR
jgi:hypothetical protein